MLPKPSPKDAFVWGESIQDSILYLRQVNEFPLIFLLHGEQKYPQPNSSFDLVLLCATSLLLF